MPQCEICHDIAIEAKDRWSPRLDRESLFDSATRGCPICQMLWQTVATHADWKFLSGLLVDPGTVLGTLTIWPIISEGGRLLDRLILYSCDGSYLTEV